ncbi:RNA polymerase alpha subunit C-terminal domain-containing protein [Daejeonella lutea]|uniref:RNA polymerase, alpha chain C terminal domain n=1 Tax=Daejeonella lutea TaxID=572036 RepID=A0A1T4ZY73_9SPHI|nr:RNA polymerase alpha subunit C-terminal domain-containing protein [Daejeonella lutea]SKB27477.1 RNA polymerase, alpha chain C terminal domain [Daejeonella lutea]
MTSDKQTLRTCPNGHSYYKSSDCPTCPVCESQRKPESGFLSGLSAPARRALENNGITTLEALARLSRKELLSFHGMGKASLPILEEALKQYGFKFREL